MHSTALSKVGVFIDWCLGNSQTHAEEGPMRTREVIITTDHDGEWPHATLSCKRIVYRTKYKRWWVPTTYRTTFVVTVNVSQPLRERYGDEMFAPATFPLLCNRLLQWTNYPHLCAANAYIDALIERLGGSSSNIRSIAL